jgi:hypothetical protein
MKEGNSCKQTNRDFKEGCSLGPVLFADRHLIFYGCILFCMRVWRASHFPYISFYVHLILSASHYAPTSHFTYLILKFGDCLGLKLASPSLILYASHILHISCISFCVSFFCVSFWLHFLHLILCFIFCVSFYLHFASHFISR